MTLLFGELVLIRVPFHQGTSGKVRPAVVLLDAGDDDFVAAPITSKARHSEFDLALENWMEAGLAVPSYVRLHKLTVLAKREIVRTRGAITEWDREAVARALCLAFCGNAEKSL